jgi:AraC-like DNA-binding protein
MATSQEHIGPSSGRRWSTEVVGPDERLDYWVGAICDAFLEMACDSRAAACFDGELNSTPLAGLSLNQVQASTQDVYRSRHAIACGRQHPYYLLTQWQHAWHVRQDGHLYALRPGDTILIDAAQPYELHFPDRVACLSVQIPRPWLAGWLRQPEARQPRTIARDHGWGRVLSTLCCELGRTPTLAEDWPASELAGHLGAVLAAALEPVQARGGAAEASLHARACALLRERFAEPGLSAVAIALSLGVSVRTLHRAFAHAEASFAATLRRLRLEQARAWLHEPRFAPLSSGEVGARCGFADASHFVREFQRTYGVTPASWRRQSMPSR